VSALQFLDTSVLLYSISAAPEEAAKRQRAIGLLDGDNVALSVQVLQEFYVQATRATRVDRLPHDIAAGLIESWLRFPLQEMTRGVLLAALEIKLAHGFSYWDSAIIAAARALGCADRRSVQVSGLRTVRQSRVIVTLMKPGFGSCPPSDTGCRKD
jgi:predicted nucleic acid-binding protein